ncbi:glycosyltransferase family protein [Salix suchowensis]|nr:glycosyltransferase family protein [Salix suchowensis]
MDFDAFNGTTDPQPRIDLMPSNVSGLAISPALATRRANATFVLLCRNSDLRGVISSIRHMEDRFNRKYKYPWVLLNEQPFTDEFKTMVSRVRILTDAPIQFGQISPDDWYQPAWIDEKRAEQGRLAMMRQHIIYAGWTLSLLEWQPTIPTLWSTVRGDCFTNKAPLVNAKSSDPTEFMDEHPEYVSANNSIEFLSDNGGLNYNLCHCKPLVAVKSPAVALTSASPQSGVISKLPIWTSGAATPTKRSSNTSTRKGDSITRKDQIHFFSDMGYMHPPFQHCPYGSEWVKGRCSCNPQDSFGVSELLSLHHGNAANDALDCTLDLEAVRSGIACDGAKNKQKQMPSTRIELVTLASR